VPVVVLPRLKLRMNVRTVAAVKMTRGTPGDAGDGDNDDRVTVFTRNDI